MMMAAQMTWSLPVVHLVQLAHETWQIRVVERIEQAPPLALFVIMVQALDRSVKLDWSILALQTGVLEQTGLVAYNFDLIKHPQHRVEEYPQPQQDYDIIQCECSTRQHLSVCQASQMMERCVEIY